MCVFSNTVNYVIPVGLFGAFMALLVVLNYLLVCTMFPAAVVVYHFFLEDRAWKNAQMAASWTWRWGLLSTVDLRATFPERSARA